MTEDSIVNVCRSAWPHSRSRSHALLAEAIGFIGQAVRAATPQAAL